jgi:hypothetical protein
MEGRGKAKAKGMMSNAFLFSILFLPKCASIGYNYFKNLVSQPVWWSVANLISRHVYEKGFLRVFEPFRARLPSQSRKSANERKNIISTKNSNIDLM